MPKGIIVAKKILTNLSKALFIQGVFMHLYQKKLQKKNKNFKKQEPLAIWEKDKLDLQVISCCKKRCLKTSSPNCFS